MEFLCSFRFAGKPPVASPNVRFPFLCFPLRTPRNKHRNLQYSFSYAYSFFCVVQAVLVWENSRHLATLPTGFPAKWRLRNERRNSKLIRRHYPDLGSASDWSCSVGNLFQPIRSTTQIWVVTRHQYGISAFFFSDVIWWGTSGSVAKCRLFSQGEAVHVNSPLQCPKCNTCATNLLPSTKYIWNCALIIELTLYSYNWIEIVL